MNSAPATAPVAKICAGCARDVVAERHVRGSDNKHYCIPCHSAKKSRRKLAKGFKVARPLLVIAALAAAIAALLLTAETGEGGDAESQSP